MPLSTQARSCRTSLLFSTLWQAEAQLAARLAAPIPRFFGQRRAPSLGRNGAAGSETGRPFMTLNATTFNPGVPLLSVVMPVYNEMATIEEIIRRVQETGV